jgi:hypothetical protein
MDQVTGRYRAAGPGAALPLATSMRSEASTLVDVGECGLLERPLGNHIVAVPGQHGGRLSSWWRWAVA